MGRLRAWVPKKIYHDLRPAFLDTVVSPSQHFELSLSGPKVFVTAISDIPLKASEQLPTNDSIYPQNAC
jgi:hypothetical protein